MIQTTLTCQPENWWPGPALYGPDIGRSRSATSNRAYLFAVPRPKSIIALGRDGALAGRFRLTGPFLECRFRATSFESNQAVQETIARGKGTTLHGCRRGVRPHGRQGLRQRRWPGHADPGAGAVNGDSAIGRSGRPARLCVSRAGANLHCATDDCIGLDRLGRMPCATSPEGNRRDRTRRACANPDRAGPAGD